VSRGRRGEGRVEERVEREELAEGVWRSRRGGVGRQEGKE